MIALTTTIRLSKQSLSELDSLCIYTGENRTTVIKRALEMLSFMYRYDDEDNRNSMKDKFDQIMNNKDKNE